MVGHRAFVSLRVLIVFFLGACGGLDEDNSHLSGTDPDWSEGAKLPVGTDRGNIYGIADEAEYRNLVWAGKRRLLVYPVGPTGVLIPSRLVREVMNWWIVRKVTGLDDLNDLYSWMGLQPYPDNERTVPFPDGAKPEYPMGVSLRFTETGDEGLTFGCAACHAGNLFGTPVLGLSNRFPRANEAFVRVHALVPYINKAVVDSVTHATAGELAMLQELKQAFRWVGVKKPAALGLDTSLAQVALSLAKRGLDEQAKKLPETARKPRPNPLANFVADSKPAVWWNLKYKTRFLSDGSLVAGNPIYTNFLWNEIGRGADLEKLDKWLQENQNVVREITAAAFATEAPRYTDFFPAEAIDEKLAQQGEEMFNRSCAGCHGRYEKAWSDQGAEGLTLAARLRTTQVFYHETTPVMNIGTDIQRATGMNHFAGRLNELAISKAIKTTVTPQRGYVPPPLVGIWARWPYFHNNSVPSLCAVLTRGDERPVTYYSGEARDRQRDFDQRCNGYPQGVAVPSSWKRREYLFDTRIAGLGNQGHDEGIFLRDGRELLTSDEKLAIIEFLKTL